MKIDDNKTFEATLSDDGDDIEVYINGLYLGNVSKKNLSKEVIEEIEAIS